MTTGLSGFFAELPCMVYNSAKGRGLRYEVLRLLTPLKLYTVPA